MNKPIGLDDFSRMYPRRSVRDQGIDRVDYYGTAQTVTAADAPTFSEPVLDEIQKWVEYAKKDQPADGGTNPKAAFGRVKPSLHAIPPSALLWLGLGKEDGEKKYGLTNWRERPVDAATYYDAAFRHLLSWWDGEDVASDSLVHHLGHVMACCAILIDAEAQGTLVDNRPSVKGMASKMIADLAAARKARQEADRG